MSEALDRLRLAFRTGRDEESDNLPGYEVTQSFVKHTEELHRVFKLPRERWTERTDLEEVSDLICSAYATSGDMRPFPVQTATLETIHDLRGAFGSIGVGEGKTFISYMAPLILEVQRCALLVPKSLEEKTKRDFDALCKHWKQPNEIKIFGYELLGCVSGATLIEEYAPEVIVADEASMLKGARAARTKQVFGYLLEHLDVVFVPLTGTDISRSIMECHHMLVRALGVERCPLPVRRTEAMEWARAIDEKVNVRTRPGALRVFLEEGEDASLANVRKAVGRRIYDSKGVIRTFDSTVEASIRIEFFDPILDPVIVQAIERDYEEMVATLRNQPATSPYPVAHCKRCGGTHNSTTPADYSRNVRTLVSGFHYEPEVIPPCPWMNARSAWNKFIREIQELDNPAWTSPLRIANACQRGELPRDVFDRWKAVRGSYKRNNVARWFSTSTLEQVIALIKHPTIIWVLFGAQGEKLSEMTGWFYYRHKGKDKKGRNVLDADPKKSMICSVESMMKGYNLQAWNHNVFLTPMTLGSTWQQALARTHRQGQLADVVYNTIVMGHPKIRAHFFQAYQDARFKFQTSQQQQKLLIADYVQPIETGEPDEFDEEYESEESWTTD